MKDGANCTTAKNDHAPHLSRLHRGHLVALGVILLAGLAVRCWHIGQAMLWWDELMSVQFAAGNARAMVQLPANQVIEPAPFLTRDRGASSWTRIVPDSIYDTHPPLHPLLLRAWQALAGSGDISARAFSVVASMLAILLLFDAVRVLSGPMPALWACVLMALAPPQVRYAQEARDYAMLVAVGMGACAAMARIHMLGVNRRRLIALGAACFGLLWTHYLGWAGAAALGLYALLHLRCTALRRTLAAFVVAGALVALVGGWQIMYQVRHGSSLVSWLQTTAPHHAARTAQRLIELPARFFGEPSWDHDVAIRYVLCLAPLLWMRHRRDLRLWAAWGLGCIAMPVVLDLVQSTTYLRHIRFTLAASPAFYALAAAGYASRPATTNNAPPPHAPHGTNRRITRLWHLVPAALAIVCIQSLQQAYNRPNPEWRQAAQWLAERAGDDDLVVYSAVDGLKLQDVVLYLGIQHYSPRLPKAMALMPRAPEVSFVEHWREHPAVWMLCSGPVPAEVLAVFDASEAKQFDQVGRFYRLSPRDR